MRAYGFLEVGGPEREAFLDVPTPEPGPGELLVRVRAAGVNPGDWRLREAQAQDKPDTVLAETAELLYGMALLAEGGELADPSRFTRLLADRLARTL